MGALALDPEILGWMREFVRARESVTIGDIQREFFPDDLGHAYLYMHRLTLDRLVYPVVNGGRPNTWITVVSPIQAKSSAPQYASTEYTERVLKFVTEEFNEGAAGNRAHLPTAFEVAMACMEGGSEEQLCHWALMHLHRLLNAGKIIQVRDEDVSEWSWHHTYYALPDSGLMAEENHEPEPPAAPGLDTWQIELLEDIERAELVSDSD